MKFLFTITLSLLLFSCAAQVEQTKYIRIVKTICPDADIIEIETKEDYIEIEYLCDRKVYEIGLSFDLKTIYTETETTLDEKLLLIIKKKLDKRYFGWTIDEFALVEMADTSFYKAEILRDGVEENVYFTLSGNYYKTKNLVINESWNITSLEQNENYANSKYKLTKPDKTFELPEILVEISGMAILNDSVVLCIQDELGVVFSYNLKSEDITKMFRFTDIGDFEDITIIDEKINILRSDGTVFSIDFKSYSGITHSKNLALNCMNVEGLFYNKANAKYLIACKDPLINQGSSLRHIYSLSKNSSTQPEIEITIDLNVLNEMFNKKYSELRKQSVAFNPSSISVHPITGEIFVLSASNRLLAVYKDKKLKDIYPLAEELFYKPEGICFSDKGDMLISTEGNKKGYVGGQIHQFIYND